MYNSGALCQDIDRLQDWKLFNRAIHAIGAEDDADEDEGEPLFDDMVDPMTLLEGMGRQQEGDEAYQEPYEVLARAKRARQQVNDKLS